jgi:hypothetical protein
MNKNNEELAEAKEIDNIINDGILLNLSIMEPTYKTLLTLNDIVYEFIKKKQRIIYGGSALNELLLDKKAKSLYNENKIPDYDFYSPEYMYDSIELCNILFNKGYKYIARIAAIHGDSYRIKAEATTGINDYTESFIADITYIPKVVYDRMPYITIKGVKYIDPIYMRIDMYKVLINPYIDLWRFKKDYVRLSLLNKYYPIKDLILRTNDNKNKNLIDLSEYINKNYNIYISGVYAVKLYFEKLNNKLSETINYDNYEFYVKDINIEIKKIKKYLPTAKILHYEPVLETMPNKCIINVNKKTIITYYYYEPYALSYIPYIIINNNKITNYYFTMRHLIIDYCINHQDIGNIICDYTTLFNDNFEDEIFKVFQIHEEKDYYFDMQINTCDALSKRNSKKHDNIYYKIQYRPEKSYIEVDYLKKEYPIKEELNYYLEI